MSCPHGGSLNDTWFSRTEPMGFVCSDCGRDVDETSAEAGKSRGSEPVTDDTMTCPACGADWTGAEIKHEVRKYYGNNTHFSRCVLVYDMERDRSVAYRCPDCRETFPRC